MRTGDRGDGLVCPAGAPRRNLGAHITLIASVI